MPRDKRAVAVAHNGSRMWKGFYRWLMDNGYESCQLCGSKEDLTFDHIIPWIRGGSSEIHNMAILCADCNEAKGSRIIELDSCVWPHPVIRIKRTDEVIIGDKTMYGVATEIIDLGYRTNNHGVLNNIIKIKYEGPCLMTTISKKIKYQRDESGGLWLSRPDYVSVYMYPGE
jgi:hypothetical protein